MGTTAAKEKAQEKNVGERERMISGIVGTGLVFAGLQRGSLGGLIVAALGAGGVYRSVTGHCALYSALEISTAPGMAQREQDVKIEETISIRRPRAEVFKYWRRLENLPKIMTNLKEVVVKDARKSHWTARGPLNQEVSWDAEIINEVENELIAWRACPDSQLPNAGSVRFEEGGAGVTHLRVSMAYSPPAGIVGATLLDLFGQDPREQLHDDLRNFKIFMEAQADGALPAQPHAAAKL